jgi:hypothetical protein
MKYEKEYIKYLSDNFKNDEVISPILDSYFLDEIDFNMVINKSEHIFNVLTYNKWVKSKKIDDLLS